MYSTVQFMYSTVNFILTGIWSLFIHVCLSFSVTFDTVDKILDVVLAGLRVDVSCWKLTVNSAAQSTSFVFLVQPKTNYFIYWIHVHFVNTCIVECTVLSAKLLNIYSRHYLTVALLSSSAFSWEINETWNHSFIFYDSQIKFNIYFMTH